MPQKAQLYKGQGKPAASKAKERRDKLRTKKGKFFKPAKKKAADFKLTEEVTKTINRRNEQVAAQRAAMNGGHLQVLKTEEGPAEASTNNKKKKINNTASSSPPQ
eukprot:jgi/Chlat1/6930/Chrsp52S06601